MKSLLRSLGALIGLAMIALALAAPAAAWDRHSLAHLSAPVAVDEHHHHHDDGSVVADHDHDGSPNEPADGDDGAGHDHMPSLVAGLADLPAQTPDLAAPEATDAADMAPEVREPPNILTAPQIRPPRFA